LKKLTSLKKLTKTLSKFLHKNPIYVIFVNNNEAAINAVAEMVPHPNQLISGETR
jgi:hypothetical protein